MRQTEQIGILQTFPQMHLQESRSFTTELQTLFRTLKETYFSLF